MRNGDLPINPIVSSDGFPSFIQAIECDNPTAMGLTKREYFAGLAMQGFISANLDGNRYWKLYTHRHDLNRRYPHLDEGDIVNNKARMKKLILECLNEL